MVLNGQRRALELVEEIRAFARNQNEEYEKERRPIAPTIERALSILRLDPMASKRALQFTYNCSPELFFNEGKIEQVLINLIRNAAEATVDNRGEITVSLEEGNGEVFIRVTDNGSGIAPELANRIWEPFFTTKGDEGTGLGLEICRRIIEALASPSACRSNSNHEDHSAACGRNQNK
jgi:signal transduction histidine kinase